MGRVAAIYPDGTVDVDYDGGNKENHLSTTLVRRQLERNFPWAPRLRLFGGVWV
jgi:hypothetical protein